VTTVLPDRGDHDVDQPGNTSHANNLLPWSSPSVAVAPSDGVEQVDACPSRPPGQPGGWLLSSRSRTGRTPVCGEGASSCTLGRKSVRSGG